MLKYDPDLAKKMLASLTVPMPKVPSSDASIVKEVKALSRPARLRGLTNITVTSYDLTVLPITQVASPNPNRRMLSFLVSTGAVIWPFQQTNPAVASFRINENSTPTYFKEEDWGEFVHQSWFAQLPSLVVACTVFTLEEYYV